MRSLIAMTHSRNDPASRFRVLQYLPLLASDGWRVSHRPNRPSRFWQPAAPSGAIRKLQRRAARSMRRLNRKRDIRDARNFDVVFLNRDLLEGELRWEKQLFAENRRVVFDFDDAIFLGQKRKEHIAWICENSAQVTVGNDYLAEFARQFSDQVTVVPSVVAAEDYALHPLAADGAVSRPANAPLRVGWLGSDLSIRETLFPYWDLLGRAQKSLGFHFVICSSPRPATPSGDLRWSFVNWSPAVEGNIADVMDIGIMPLVDNEYQRGKCGMKLLQYMAAGLPVVASPIGVNVDIVRDGECGFLAGSDVDWIEALTALLTSEDLRRRYGKAGRRHCESHYSRSAWFPVLRDLFTEVGMSKPHARILS